MRIRFAPAGPGSGIALPGTPERIPLSAVMLTYDRIAHTDTGRGIVNMKLFLDRSGHRAG